MRAAILTSALLIASAASAAENIDMNDPRRAVGREDDVRIDAQLLHDTVSSGSPISVRYQVQNLTSTPVAVATKVTDASYDPESQTITVGIGSEIPAEGKMPLIVTIAPGEKKVFSAAVTPLIPASSGNTLYATVPRYVQVKVTVLRDVATFATVVANRLLTDEQFDKWMKGNDTIFLNTIPVRYEPRKRTGIDVENRNAHATF